MAQRKNITGALEDLGPVPVGQIAFGCWRLDTANPGAAAARLDAALDLGMTLVDTADVYGYGTDAGFGSVETVMGQVFEKRPDLRDRMVLATKGGVLPPTPYNSAEDYLISACEASLKRLCTDRIDLYQVHRPDLLAHPRRVADALMRLHSEGKIRAVGVSNYSAAQIQTLQRHLELPILTVQSEFSAWHVEPAFDGVLEACLLNDFAFMAWSPLAGGSIATGNPPEGVDIARFHALITVLDEIAAHHSVNRSQIALAFLLRHPAGVIPIVGTQNIARLEEAAYAARLTMGRREWYSILEAQRGAPMP